LKQTCCFEAKLVDLVSPSLRRCSYQSKAFLFSEKSFPLIKAQPGITCHCSNAPKVIVQHLSFRIGPSLGVWLLVLNLKQLIFGQGQKDVGTKTRVLAIFESD
jgi:hypothetical protein